MQTSAWQPPIRIPKFNQHQIKLSEGEGIGSITHNVKGIIVLDCIEMRRRKLCWFYIPSVCMLYVCTPCAVCPAVLYGCLTDSICFVPLSLCRAKYRCEVLLRRLWFRLCLCSSCGVLLCLPGCPHFPKPVKAERGAAAHGAHLHEK